MSYNLKFVSKDMKSILLPAINHRHYLQTKLHYREYDHSYIAPFYEWRESIGGVADQNKIAIVDSRNIEWAESFKPYCSDIPIVEHKTVIYVGVLFSGFGHCFTDNLRKLWFLKTEEYRKLIEGGAEVVYTTDHNQDLPPYAILILKYAQFDVLLTRHITKLTAFDKIIVPDNSFYSEIYGRCFTNEYKQCVENIISSLSSIDCKLNVPERVYLSRMKFSQRPEFRREVGEAAIERLMNKEGYISIYPEELSFAEQVYIVQHCKYLATTEGSIAHIVLFCPPSCNITIFCKAKYLNYHQVAVNEFSNARITYVEAHHSLRMNREIPWYGPFYLCITKYVEAFMGHSICHFPFFIKPSFWRYLGLLPRLLNKIFKLLNIKKQ